MVLRSFGTRPDCQGAELEMDDEEIDEIPVNAIADAIFCDSPSSVPSFDE